MQKHSYAYSRYGTRLSAVRPGGNAMPTASLSIIFYAARGYFAPILCASIQPAVL
ncbi:hypothetical protein [Polluticaenibacter yanchengensis]|uniref:Uncharacterized protein n=1 Tax=Polluticaenibacter yanchengensis TaxID=3014562 RepID=A0ABT4UN44_9BACT|nr:hypothetical protein [Chitinophagaceae bacterium LY-5]